MAQPIRGEPTMAMKLRATKIAIAIILAFLAPQSFAQTYPTRPVRLILPYGPGGIVDFIGRTLARSLSDTLGQTVVAENKPGAGGVVGTSFVGTSQNDGYTLLLMDPAIVINPTLQARVPYDLFKQFETVSVVSSSPEVLIVSPALNVKTFDELVAYGKANPGKLNFASAGVGTTPHLAAEMFKQQAGVDAVHVPYKGIGASFLDMTSNKVQFAFSSIAGALPFTSDNRLLPLATTGEERTPVYSKLPTVAEAGLKGFSVDLWLAVFAPVGIRADVKAKLNTALKEALDKPELKSAFATVGVVPRGTTPEEGAAFVKADFEKWKKVITDGNIKVE
jgi:tripartite-type tricarboxylate transporter receptor subunit TctC